MLIQRTNPITNQLIERDIPVSEQQMANYEAGMHIQDAMPNLSADDREFILTGITPEQWDEIFGEEE